MAALTGSMRLKTSRQIIVLGGGSFQKRDKKTNVAEAVVLLWTTILAVKQAPYRAFFCLARGPSHGRGEKASSRGRWDRHKGDSQHLRAVVSRDASEK